MTTRVDDPFSRALRRRWRIASFAALAFFGFALGVGFWGVPFGEHWDEWYAQRGTKKSLERLDLFPGDFTYNGLYFDLAFLPLVDDVVEHLPAIFKEIEAAPTRPLDPTKYPSIAKMEKELRPLTRRDAYVHQTRRLFCTLTVLLVLFSFFASRALWPLRPAAAVVAAAVAATSWELGYHARYIAVDALMASFAGLMFWCIFEARRADAALRPILAQLCWIVAAVAGGLAFGGKVTGVFFCVPIGLGALLSPPHTTWTRPALVGSGWRRRFFTTASVKSAVVFVVDDLRHTGLARVRRCAAVAVVFVVSFLMTTPGFVRDPIRLAAGVFHTAKTYKAGKFAYATHELPEHLVKLYGWLLLKAPAPYIPAAIVLSLLAVVGAVHLLRRRPVESVVLFSFFACWSVVLLRAQQLAVRNALALIPVVVLCVAAGVVVVGSRGPRVRVALGVVLAAVFASSMVFDVLAARTIHTTTAATIRKDAARWLLEHDDQPLILGPRLHKAIGPSLAKRYTCDVRPAALPTAAARVALFFDEHDRFKWQSNTLGFYDAQFSSMETNIAYYANWRGKFFHDRISVLSVENAQKNRMKLRRWVLCTPTSLAAQPTFTAPPTTSPKTAPKTSPKTPPPPPPLPEEPEPTDEPRDRAEIEEQRELDERERELEASP